MSSYNMPIAIALIAGLFGAAHISSENGTKAVIEANNLNADEAAAYRVCEKEMSGKNLTLRTRHGAIEYKSVPTDLCACQARTMAKIFKPGQYDSHANVIEFATVGKNPVATVVTTDLRPDVGDGQAAFYALAMSLAQCREALQDKVEKARDEAQAAANIRRQQRAVGPPEADHAAPGSR